MNEKKNDNNTLTKRELISKIASKSEIPQEKVQTVLQMTLDMMTDALEAGRHIEFRDFGVFEIVTRRSRIGRNPNSPANTVIIPERKVVKFKAGKKMKALVEKA